VRVERAAHDRCSRDAPRAGSHTTDAVATRREGRKDRTRPMAMQLRLYTSKSSACVHRNKSSHAFSHFHVHSAPCRDQKRKQGKMTACAHRAACTRLSECSVRPRSIFLVWCQRGPSCVGALERATPIFVRHRACTQDGPSPSIFRWFRLCLPCMPTLLISCPWQASSHGESISATHLLASLPSNSPRCFFIRAPITCGWNASAKRQRA
jgi:hypothetical protein